MGRKRRRCQTLLGGSPVPRELAVTAPPPGETSWACFSCNPHLEQNRGGIFHINEHLNRVLDRSASRMPYRRRDSEVKSTLHWGQRKLLLSEIEFLTEHAPAGSNIEVCIYLGAAHGTHIPFLASLFKHLQFVLIDPSPFGITTTSQIIIREEFATPEMCAEYSARRCVLVSDIRTADYRVLDASAVERSVAADMDLQMRCCLAVQPKAAVLKFRLPWSPGESMYLDGTVYLPVWGPQTTTESRLVCSGSETRMWDHREYNERMFYFNTVSRPAPYRHDVTGVSGLDHCYDCSAEVLILERYLKVFDAREASSADSVMSRRVKSMIHSVSEACSGRVYRDLSTWSCAKKFQKKLFDCERRTVILLGDDPAVTESGCDGADDGLSGGAVDACVDAFLRLSGASEGRWWLIPEDQLQVEAQYERPAASGQDSWKSAAEWGPFYIGFVVPERSPACLWVWAVLAQFARGAAPSPSSSPPAVSCDEAPGPCWPDSTSREGGGKNNAGPAADGAAGTARGHLQWSVAHREDISAELFRIGESFSKDSASPPFVAEASKCYLLLLFCRSGCAYIVWADSPAILCRTVLPTINWEHGTLVYGYIDLSEGPEKKILVVESLLTRKGERILTYDKNKGERNEFVMSELIPLHEPSARFEMFCQSGFSDIKSSAW
jgi:hypothetical protein